MENKLSLREALGLGFMFAFRNLGTIFIAFLVPIILVIVDAFFKNYFQNIIARFSVEFLFNFLIATFSALIILPLFLGLYRTGKPIYTLELSKKLLKRVFAITLINEIILLNLKVVGLVREMPPINIERFALFLGIEILLIAVFIVLVYPYTYFSTLFVIDQNFSVKQALKASADLVNGHAIYFFFIMILLGLMLALSILTIVGPIIIMGVFEIVFIHFYHVLQGRENEMVRLH